MQAESVAPLIVWIVLTPLLGAAFQAWMGPRLPPFWVALFANLTLPIALVVALLSYGSADMHTARVLSASYSWLSVGDMQLDVRLCLDAVSMLMVAIICGVGSLIHIFSASYMKGDAGFARYFAYLNFFCAMMLLLVLSDSLPVMFIGWEGVGLASYLLIGFHHHEAFRVRAAHKAFVVNRIGDAGLLVAMFVLMNATHALSFSGLELAASRGAISEVAATASMLLVGLAVAGKSAQLPLFVWLPDAMAGPTPVSALIHAATMVTAGVYLLARLGFLLAMAPLAMMVLGTVAAATMLLAALCALLQYDIKRVLAYSTVSQLGYMVLAAATGAAPLALFHVTTHAFFKACLFLAAAALIHAQDGEQDMRKMGGLFGRMPLVALCFLACTLAIAGVPPFSGFASKDAILGHIAALASDPHTPLHGLAPYLWWVSELTALLTAVYMGRAFCLTFLSGSYRGPEARAHHLHDAPVGMAIPLSMLAAMALSGGALSWPHSLGGEDKLVRWLAAVLDREALPHAAVLGEAQEYGLMGLSAALGVLGLGWSFFVNGRQLCARELTQPSVTRTTFAESGGVDALYRVWFVAPFERASKVLLPKTFEQGITLGLPRSLARLSQTAGFVGQLLHSGNVQRGAAMLVVGAALMLYGWLMPAHMTLPALSLQNLPSLVSPP